MASDPVRFSPAQSKVIENFGRGMAVLAGAGSGKTTTLVAKCAELLRRDPAARFAAVSFTERSASDLKAKLSGALGGDGLRDLLGGSGVLGGHWVSTIHGLCANVIREYPREAGYDGEESMLSEGDARRLWDRAVESLWFDPLPPELTDALALLLGRESREGLSDLLARSRQLSAFGALESLSASADGCAVALGRLSAHVQLRYDRLKRRRGAMDFDDLERGARRALDVEAVREAYHRRFALVLVDEFQDTNPLQAGIIRDFCRPDRSNLCVVGDPKQSIYRFRDADVAVFEDFCSRLPERHSLNWNFRSRPAIIDYANSLCERAFREAGMAYERLEPRRDPPAGGEAVVRLDVRDPKELGAWIRSESARGVRLDSMALLVRRIRGNEKWFKALTAAGIPLALGSGGLFWEDPRVRELVAFLRWWDEPANVYSGLVFLRAPWVAVPDGVLDGWVTSGGRLDELFLGLSHPLAVALRPHRGAQVTPGELLLSLLVDHGIEDEIGSALLGLWHRVEELSCSGAGFHEVVLEVGRAAAEGRRERDVPPPRNLGQLPVLTLHSAKGLEFDHVLLVDLGKKPRTPSSPLLHWDREDGAFLTPRDEDGDRDRKDPGLRRWEARERARSLAESMRIFYVALTRARERLVLVCPELEAEALEAARDASSAFTQDHWRAWVESCGVAAPPAPRARDSDSGPLAGPVEPGRRRPASFTRPADLIRPRHSVTELALLARCPRAYEWTHIRPRLGLAGQEADLPGVRGAAGVEMRDEAPRTALDARELGTLVHRALETGDEEALRRIEREAGRDRFSAEQVIAWSRRARLGEEWEESRSELGFEIPVDGEVLVGAMDRVLRRGNEYLVVDYKITASSRSSEELTRAYGVPMRLYGWALSKLEPEARNPGLLLVGFSTTAVTEARIPAEGTDVGALVSRARAIVQGEPGIPEPGSSCRYCVFRGRCPEAVS